MSSYSPSGQIFRVDERVERGKIRDQSERKAEILAGFQRERSENRLLRRLRHVADVIGAGINGERAIAHVPVPAIWAYQIRANSKPMSCPMPMHMNAIA